MDELDGLGYLLAGAFMILLLIIVIMIALYVVYIIGLWKLFKKGGKDGWKAIIPFYNTWTFVEMVGLEWYWFLIICASTITSIIGIEALNYLGYIASLLGNICLYYNLSKKCHKDAAWIVLTVFFGWITIPVLGFSKNTVFDNSVVTSPNGFFGGNNTNNNPNGNNYTDYNQNNNQNNQGN